MVETSLMARSENPTQKGIEQNCSGSRDILTCLGFNPALSTPIRPVSNVTECALSGSYALDLPFDVRMHYFIL
jgi:hypothetical protein